MAQHNAQRCILKAFSGGFNTMSVVNLLNWKLANHISVQWCVLVHFLSIPVMPFEKYCSCEKQNRTRNGTKCTIVCTLKQIYKYNMIQKSWHYDLLCLMYSLFLMRSMHYSFQLNQNMSTDCQKLTHFLRHRFCNSFLCQKK